jgi:acid phosphatase family membrane protein YuiD
MPSSHSAIVSSLATSIFLIHWIFSEPFAVVTTFTIIIIYDAINVRYEAWLHAKAINNILGKKATNKMLWRDKLKESLWHLPSEAFAWVVVWMIVAFILYII